MAIEYAQYYKVKIMKKILFLLMLFNFKFVKCELIEFIIKNEKEFNKWQENFVRFASTENGNTSPDINKLLREDRKFFSVLIDTEMLKHWYTLENNNDANELQKLCQDMNVIMWYY